MKGKRAAPGVVETYLQERHPPLAVQLTLHPRVAFRVRSLLQRAVKKHQKALEKSTFIPEPGKMDANAFWVNTLGTIVREIDVQIGDRRAKENNEGEGTE